MFFSISTLTSLNLRFLGLTIDVIKLMFVSYIKLFIAQTNLKPQK